MAFTKKLINFDPYGKIYTYHAYDYETDTSVFESVSDATPTLEINRKIANDTDNTKQGIKEGWWMYASIPNIVVHKLLVEKGINVYKKEHAGALSKILEDPDYRYLKTTDKRHIMTGHD